MRTQKQLKVFFLSISFLFLIFIFASPPGHSSRYLSPLTSLTSKTPHLPSSFRPQTLTLNSSALSPRDLSQSYAHPPPQKRIDLSDKDFITIDPEDAHELDDAVYVNSHNGVYECFVAIADPTPYLTDSDVVQRAVEQSFTLYHESPVKFLLPRDITSQTSLEPNEERPAVVVKFNIDPKGVFIGDVEIFKAMIISKAKLNYEEVNSYIRNNSSMSLGLNPNLLTSFFKASLALHSFRLKQNAGDTISSENAVAEMMIAANILVAKHLKDMGLEAVFRTQHKSGERAFYTSSPDSHASIKALYTHFTSPLRRMPDMLVHWVLFEDKPWELLAKHLNLDPRDQDVRAFVLDKINTVAFAIKDFERDQKKASKKQRRASFHNSHTQIKYKKVRPRSLSESGIEDRNAQLMAMNSKFMEIDDEGLDEFDIYEKKKAKKAKKAEKKRRRKASKYNPSYEADMLDSRMNRKIMRIRSREAELEENLRRLDSNEDIDFEDYDSYQYSSDEEDDEMKPNATSKSKSTSLGNFFK